MQKYDVIVVGAGTIAVELASAYAHFGTDVTVLVRSDVMLRGMDRDELLIRGRILSVEVEGA